MRAAEGQIREFDSPGEVAEAAADILLHVALEVGADCARIALSGGSTPRAMYQALCRRGESAARILRWVHFFFGDERTVPQDHQDSNVRLAREELFEPLQLLHNRLHPIDGAAEDLHAEARRATQELNRLLRKSPSGVPQFDMVILGMGEDGHTASLFPGTAGLGSLHPGYVVNEVPQLDTRRLTLTLPVINAAKQVIILCTGARKHAVLERVIGRTPRLSSYPIELVDAEKVVWLTDYQPPDTRDQ